MRRSSLFLAAMACVVAFDGARAIDVNPSKNNQPPTFWESGGNHFSIFNGDPKRIQRANAVDPKAFDAKLEISPTPISFKALKALPTPGFKVTFSVHNHAKKTYTLSFPTAQRWDFRILNSAGTQVYLYSDNCQFEQKVGTSMVNNDDKLSYSDTVELGDISGGLEPGNYKVEAVLANYPEIRTSIDLTVQP